MTTVPFFGLQLVDPRPRAVQMAGLRVGQRVRLLRAKTDRFPLDAMHQLRIAADTLVEITALAGHSGQHTRYRFELLDARGRRTGLWNYALEDELEAIPSARRVRIRRVLAAVGLAAVLIAASACTGPTPSTHPSASAAPSQPVADGERTAAELAGPTGTIETATVVAVVDGDTIKVELADGSVATVRYIGVDTPETVHPTRDVEPFGPEASEANAALVGGSQVTLELDISPTDRYGRLLRYVWIGSDGDWTLVGAELLRAGLATISTYPPDVKWVDPIYVPAQELAQSAGRGIWSDATPTPSASAAPTPAVSSDPDQPISGCHPEYSACLPIVTDLNCADIPDRRFESTGDDPYELDGNGDGIACESD